MSTAGPADAAPPGSTTPAAIVAAGLAEGDTADRRAEDAVEVAGNSYIKTRIADVAAAGSAAPTAARPRLELKAIPIPAKRRIRAGRVKRIKHIPEDTGRKRSTSTRTAGRKIDTLKPMKLDKHDLPTSHLQAQGAPQKQKTGTGAGR